MRPPSPSPSLRSASRCLSENTFNAALRRMGFTTDQATAHGFRASFSTMANESRLWSADAIERALAHEEEKSARRAYARGEHWDERKHMAAWWTDQCGKLRMGGCARRAFWQIDVSPYRLTRCLERRFDRRSLNVLRQTCWANGLIRYALEALIHIALRFTEGGKPWRALHAAGAAVGGTPSGAVEHFSSGFGK